MTASRTIAIERVLPHPPERVWRALTDGSLIARWLMPNDFAPVVGHRFTFQAEPMGEWDGVVRCEVLACEPDRLLRYSWNGGCHDNAKYGSFLESIVTWRLESASGGTLLRLEHSGFRSPGNDFAFEAMNSGWRGVLDTLVLSVGETV